MYAYFEAVIFVPFSQFGNVKMGKRHNGKKDQIWNASIKAILRTYYVGTVIAYLKDDTLHTIGGLIKKRFRREGRTETALIVAVTVRLN